MEKAKLMQKNNFWKIAVKILAYAILSVLAIVLPTIYCLLLGMIPGAYMNVCFCEGCGYEATGKLGALIGFIISASLVLYLWMINWKKIVK